MGNGAIGVNYTGVGQLMIGTVLTETGGEMGMGWRNDPITEKQEIMIAKIEEDAMMNDAFIPPFSGSTKGDACDYIGNYIHACHLSAFDPNEDAGDRV